MKKRKNIRIPEYDYSKEGMYFITICTQNRKKILSKIENLNNEEINNCRGKAPSLPKNTTIENKDVGADDPVRPKLTSIGRMINNIIKSTERIYENIKIDKYVIMPNHVHMIIIIKGGRTESSAPTKDYSRNKICFYKRILENFQQKRDKIMVTQLL